MNSSQGFPFKHVKINISSVLIHKYTLQQSFSLEECATLPKPNFFFICSALLSRPRMDWILSKAEIKYDLIGSQFLEIL